MPVVDMVNRFERNKRISRREYEKFVSLVKQDGEIEDRELEQINRLFELVRSGKVSVKN